VLFVDGSRRCGQSCPAASCRSSSRMHPSNLPNTLASAGVKLSKKLALQHFAQSASWHGVEHGRPDSERSCACRAR
jgi:hypothetical protein